MLITHRIKKMPVWRKRNMAKTIKVGAVGLDRIGVTVHSECMKARHDKFKGVAACDLIPDRMHGMRRSSDTVFLK